MGAATGTEIQIPPQSTRSRKPPPRKLWRATHCRRLPPERKNNGTGTNSPRPNARSNNAGTNNSRLSARSNNADTQNRFAAKSGGQRVADDSTLTGKCLVYIGSGKNDLYKESVIYITDSSPESVKGIMINKLLFGSAVVECRNHEDGGEKDVRGVYEDLYQGGPVNPANGFVLFPSDGYFYSDPHARVQGEIAISSSFGVLQDILDGEGPDKRLSPWGIASGNAASWNGRFSITNG